MTTHETNCARQYHEIGAVGGGRILRLACGLALLLALLTGMLFSGGCGGPPDTTPDGRAIVTFWHMYNDQEEAVLLEIVGEFEKLNPKLKVNPVRIPFDGHKPKIRTAVTVEKAPDCARVDWSFVCELARKKAVVDLDQFGFRQVAAEYLPAALGTNLIDGKYYGLPDQTNGVALFYNRAMFKAAGLDPDQPPRTWEEFVEFGKKLTKPDGSQYAFAMDNTLWWTLPILNTFGAPFLSEDGRTCLLDSASGVAALEFKASLYAVHKIEAGSWQPGAISPESGFINQKFAMIFMGPWNLPKFTTAGLDFGVGLIPAGPAGTSTNVGGTNVVIFAGSKRQREAFDFLRFLTSSAAQSKWCRKLQQLPVNLRVYDEVKLDDPKLNVFMEQMKTARPNPVVTNYGDLEELVNPEMAAVLSGQKTASEALFTAARKVEEKVLRVGLDETVPATSPATGAAPSADPGGATPSESGGAGAVRTSGAAPGVTGGSAPERTAGGGDVPVAPGTEGGTGDVTSGGSPSESGSTAAPGFQPDGAASSGSGSPAAAGGAGSGSEPAPN